MLRFVRTPHDRACPRSTEAPSPISCWATSNAQTKVCPEPSRRRERGTPLPSPSRRGRFEHRARSGRRHSDQGSAISGPVEFRGIQFGTGRGFGAKRVSVLDAGDRADLDPAGTLIMEQPPAPALEQVRPRRLTRMLAPTFRPVQLLARTCDWSCRQDPKQCESIASDPFFVPGSA